MKLRPAVTSLVPALSLFAASAYGIDIVESGVARSAIVSPQNPPPVVQYAIEEFRQHLELATGVRLDVFNENDVIPQELGRIYIGGANHLEATVGSTAALKDNCFYIINSGNELSLVGKDGDGVPPFDDDKSMGTLFAVYQWLEDHLGVKWLWPGRLGTVVPPRDNVSDSVKRTTRHEAPFIHSRLRHGVGVLDYWQEVMPKQERQKFLYETAVWLRRHRFARPTSFNYGHGYTDYWTRFGTTHPEWFALRTDGVRGPIDEHTHVVQMCVSNEALQTQIIEDWQKRRKAAPWLPWINGMENDKRVQDPPCQCDACKLWDGKTSRALTSSDPYLFDSKGNTPQDKTPKIPISMSNRYARFWLALQKKGEKYDPHAIVAGYAYADYAFPPKEVKLNSRITVGVVPPFVYPHDPQNLSYFQDLWKGWADTGAELMLRPNYFYMGAGLPYFFAKQFGSDFKFAVDHGLKGTDFDSLTSMWAVQGPNLYMLGRLHGAPTKEVEDILNEYYSGFGDGSEFVRQYFQLWEKITNERATPSRLREIPNYPWYGLYVEARTIYRKEDLANGERLLNQALSATADDKQAKERVEFLLKGLTHTLLSLEMMDAFKEHKDKSTEISLEKLQESLARLNSFRQSLIGGNVIDLAFLNFLELRSGVNKLQVERHAGREVAARLPLFWDVRWDANDIGIDEKWFVAKSSSEWSKVRTDKALNQQQIGQNRPPNPDSDGATTMWYKTEFSIPDKFADRKLLLGFEGVGGNIEVWLNGTKLQINDPLPTNATPEPQINDYLARIVEALPIGHKNVVVVRLRESGKNLKGIERPVRLLADF